MNKKVLQVSIGIPAFNEGKNIKKLLSTLLRQNRDNFILKEIIVFSDGSTDNTVDEVFSINNNRVKLIQNKKRVGQAAGQNKIIKLFTGDILVLLNADVLPSNRKFISNIISPFRFNKNIALVGPKISPLKGNTFFENIINYSVSFKDSIFENWRSGNNLYLCSGRGRAFSKAFAKKIFWKTSLSEDAYSYLFCIEEGYDFKYIQSAQLLYKSPDSFTDHIKQSARFTAGPSIMFKYFNKRLVLSEYAVPKKIAIIEFFVFLFKNPVLFISYLLTLVIIKIYPYKSKYINPKWDISKSSKSLNKDL